MTGKSGVGKSNFVLSLAGIFEDDEQVEVLMYNAARLDAAVGAMIAKISQVWQINSSTGQTLIDLFAEIDKSEDMTGRQFDPDL